MGYQIFLLPLVFWGGVVFLFLAVKYIRRRIYIYRMKPHLPKLIPGGIPYFGNIFGFDRTKPHLVLSELHQKHGSIFRLKLLGQDIVVVNESKLIREALMNPDLAGRPYLFRVHYGFHYSDDVIFGTFSEKWSAMKNVAIKAVKEYGTGRRIEAIMAAEIESMVGYVDGKVGEAFDPSQLTLTCVVNAITASVLGKRYEYDAPEMHEYKLITRLFSESCSTVQGLELDLFPMLRFLPNETFRKLNLARDLLDAYVDKELAEVKARGLGDAPRCMLEAFMQMAAKNEGKYELEATDMTEEDARALFIDILVSGTLTTSIALNCFLMYMVLYPEVQVRARMEVLAALGEPGAKPQTSVPGDRTSVPGNRTSVPGDQTSVPGDRTSVLEDKTAGNPILILPDEASEVDPDPGAVPSAQPSVPSASLLHRDSVPYLSAVVLETLRQISHVPLSLPHAARSDTKLGAYDVLSGTQVLLNLWAMHHDPRAFPEPWRFRPERWLEEDRGECLSDVRLLHPGEGLRRHLLPFGVGRRMCIGEVMARDRLLAFGAALLQNFTFGAESDEAMPDGDPRTFQLGLILEPKPFTIRAFPRERYGDGDSSEEEF